MLSLALLRLSMPTRRLSVRWKRPAVTSNSTPTRVHVRRGRRLVGSSPTQPATASDLQVFEHQSRRRSSPWRWTMAMGEKLLLWSSSPGRTTKPLEAGKHCWTRKYGSRTGHLTAGHRPYEHSSTVICVNTLSKEERELCKRLWRLARRSSRVAT